MGYGVDSMGWTQKKGGWLRRGEVKCISITPSKLPITPSKLRVMSKHGRLAPNECLLGTRNREIAKNPRNHSFAIFSPHALPREYPRILFGMPRGQTRAVDWIDLRPHAPIDGSVGSTNHGSKIQIIPTHLKGGKRGDSAWHKQNEEKKRNSNQAKPNGP